MTAPLHRAEAVPGDDLSRCPPALARDMARLEADLTLWTDGPWQMPDRPRMPVHDALPRYADLRSGRLVARGPAPLWRHPAALACAVLVVGAVLSCVL